MLTKNNTVHERFNLFCKVSVLEFMVLILNNNKRGRTNLSNKETYLWQKKGYFIVRYK